MTDRKFVQSDEGESYFISMTDMMIGVLFVFIIMLMAFALNLREEKDNLVQSTQTRTEILQTLKNELRKRGVNVKIDEKRGVLRLPEQILFSKGSSELSISGIGKVEILAGVLADILPCYTYFLFNNRPDHLDCSGRKHHIDAVLIEGHTDSTKYGDIDDKNWDLSTQRAITAFRTMIASEGSLSNMINPLGQKILSVSGYADSRPANTEDTEAAENRRIDLRFIMAVPHMVEIK